MTGPVSFRATFVCHGFIGVVGMQLTHWRIGTCQNALLFEVSDEIRGCYHGVTNEEKEGALYYPSDHNCRKFCDKKLMKIRRLDWNLYLSMASSLHRTHYWLHSVLWVGPNFERLISFARTHPGALWGLCNDKPRGFFYHRNCYIAYTQSRSLKLAQRECWPVWEGVFSNKPSSIDNNISTGKGDNASGSTFTKHANMKHLCIVYQTEDKGLYARPTRRKNLSRNEPLFDQTNALVNAARL